nr:hypothetical protein CFP56_23417 [Quercus suber]
MGYVGSDYTWSKRLGGLGWVRERLDRALVSTDWAVMFPSVKLFLMSNSVSDHSILVLKEARPPPLPGGRGIDQRFFDLNLCGLEMGDVMKW